MLLYPGETTGERQGNAEVLDHSVLTDQRALLVIVFSRRQRNNLSQRLLPDKDRELR